MAHVRLGLGVPLAIEASQHEHVACSDAFEAGLADTKPCGPRQFERGELEALHVVPVPPLGQFREPDFLLVLDRDLGPGAAHAGAEFERFKHFVRQAAVFLKPARRARRAFGPCRLTRLLDTRYLTIQMDKRRLFG